MKGKNSIIVVVSGMIIVLAIVLLGALSNSNTDNTNKAPSPITPLFKPKEPTTKLIDSIEETRIPGNQLLFIEKQKYKEVDGKGVWIYGPDERGVVYEFMSSDKKAIDEFRYTFDIDSPNNNVIRRDIVDLSLTRFNSSLQDIFKIENTESIYMDAEKVYRAYKDGKDIIHEVESNFTLNGYPNNWSCTFKYSDNDIIDQTAKANNINDQSRIENAYKDTVTCRINK